MAGDGGTLIDIGGVKIRLTLDDASVSPAVDRAKKTISSIDRAAGVAIKSIAGVVTAAVTSVSAVVGLAIRRADQLNLLSQKIGVSVEALSRLQYAARMNDVSLESLGTSVTRLNRNLAEAASGGSKELKAIFDELNISLKENDGSMRGSTEILTDLADVFARTPDGVQKTALAVQLFGRSGAELIPLLNEGSKGIKAFADESDRLGFTISTKTAKDADRFGDTLDKIRASIEGVGARIATGVLPHLQDFADLLASPEFAEAATTLATTVVGALSAISQAIVGVINMLKDMGGAIADAFEYATEEPARRTSERLRKDIADYEKMLSDHASGRSWIFDPAAVEQRLNESRAALRQMSIKEFTPQGPRGRGGRRGTGDKDAPTSPEDEDLVNLPVFGGITEDKIAEKLDILRQGLMTEKELVASHYQDELDQLADFQERGLLSADEYAQLRTKIEVKYWDEMKRINAEGMSALEQFNRLSWDKQAQQVFGQLQSITEGVKDHNDVLFNINKGAAIANAVLNAYEGISKSLASYPAPLSFIMAGVQAAAAFAQVTALLSTTRNTKSASPVGLSGASSEATAATSGNSAATGETGPTRRLFVEGINPADLFSGAMVSDLAKRLLKFQEDGGKVILT